MLFPIGFARVRIAKEAILIVAIDHTDTTAAMLQMDAKTTEVDDVLRQKQI